MPLSVVTEVLNNGGYLPQLAELSKAGSSIFNRRNGLGFSAIWIVFLLLLTALAGVAGADELAGGLAIIGVFGALLVVLFSLIFLRQAPKQSNLARDQIAELSGARARAALAPNQTVPADFYTPQRTDWRDTSDLEPTSVTDSTTRLLEKNPRD